MPDQDDPFAAGIELEFDEMEARRQAPQADDPFGAVGHSPGGKIHSTRPPGAMTSEPAPPVVTGMDPSVGPASVPKPASPPVEANYQPLETEAKPAPAIWKSLLSFVGVVLLAGAFLLYWYRHDLFPPAAADIVAEVSEGPDGQLVYRGQTYQATFVVEQEIEGTVNQIETTFYPRMPVVTHGLLLVTGEYNDPSLVRISPFENHQVLVEPLKTNLEGKATLVHLIAADAIALADIQKIKPGAYVVILGDVVEGLLSDPSGTVSMDSEEKSKLIRVREVLFDQSPPEK